MKSSKKALLSRLCGDNMNIGIDLRCLLTRERTGVGEFAHELLTSLFQADKNNQYFLFSNSSSLVPPEFSGPNIHILHTKIPNKIFNFLQIFGIGKIDQTIIKRFHLPGLDLFFSPHLNFTALSKDAKHVLLIHDLTFELFPELFTSKQRLWHHLLSAKEQCKKAAIIFTPSASTKRDLLEHFKIDQDKIQILTPGLSKIYFQAHASDVRKKYDLPEKYFLFLGTLEPRKNVQAIIEAYERYTEKYKTDYHLVLAGASGWKNRYLLKKISSSKYYPKIHLIGYIMDKEKPELYRNASVFLYPSIYEGFGFPALEALSQGIPVITSNRSSLPEIAKNNAFLINPHRPEEIVKGMELFTISSYQKNNFQNGKLSTLNYRWEFTAQTWINTIKTKFGGS